MTRPVPTRVLITGGAGFVGASLAVGLRARHADWEVIALDNLARRGSELNLPRLDAAGASFVHGDVRQRADLEGLGPVDAIVECSAEPSVLAGVGGSPDYLVQTNLVGAYHCLELARRDDAQLVFLSTSRVYPVAGLLAIPLQEAPTRFEIDAAASASLAGVSAAGVAETMALEGARTLYGATKLAAELLIGEYAQTYGLRAVVDRCGVIAGPWQMGRADQGIFTFWMAAHVFGRPLSYLGFEGTGRQVRDLLHVEDLVELIDEQLGEPDRWAGATVNVGGGRKGSLSLAEATELCRAISGREVGVSADGTDRPGDVPLYLSDCDRLESMTAWRPSRSPEQILEDVHAWLRAHETLLRDVL